MASSGQQDVEIIDSPSPENSSAKTCDVRTPSSSGKLRSEVHDHFTLHTDDDRYHCHYCSASYKKSSSGAISGLRQHLKSTHHTVLKGNDGIESQKRKSIFDTPAHSKQPKHDKEVFREKIATFVVLNHQPFTITESESLRDVIQYLKHDADMFGRDTTKNDIVSIMIKKDWDENYKPKNQDGKSSPPAEGSKLVQDFSSIASAGETSCGLIKWWVARKEEYPNLSRMELDYLSVPGSGASVERMFSNGPDLLSQRRLSMTADTIKMMMCLRGWILSKKQDELKKCVVKQLFRKF
ncbi:Zinc finger BED domain-containing protein DAYSLEEPER [Folsomia candida]|uniref:Zinc finger BED domain-containing protein DAYSLEEPER n=1 Tax=Folsomia candida TaxID=158441 RepID=A0A226DC80_FOLCA|nr:Zinc finger BED domain-containing protein DAYSLEEPER [Folsomia candida]